MNHLPKILLLFLFNLLFITLVNVEFPDHDSFTGEAVVRHHPYANIAVLIVFTLLLYYFQYQNVLYHVRKKASALQNINPITFVLLFFLFFLYFFSYYFDYPLISNQAFGGDGFSTVILFFLFIIYFFIVRAFFMHYSYQEFSAQKAYQKK